MKRMRLRVLLGAVVLPGMLFSAAAEEPGVALPCRGWAPATCAIIRPIMETRINNLPEFITIPRVVGSKSTVCLLYYSLGALAKR